MEWLVFADGFVGGNNAMIIIISLVITVVANSVAEVGAGARLSYRRRIGLCIPCSSLHIFIPSSHILYMTVGCVFHTVFRP